MGNPVRTDISERPRQTQRPHTSGNLRDRLPGSGGIGVVEQQNNGRKPHESGVDTLPQSGHVHGRRGIIGHVRSL